ncbi:hypothetical protein QBC38DRAFT_484663 [Podospora fimiseda]|uniref:Uncharacterized protein n=1 Tax=Podospora fimiseda TaxID=252190 RepID=A0AAN7H095_9PEZI|nr:hypothetical protein QBC38DRAFT_484663 [Podospora fimiseda]
MRKRMSRLFIPISSPVLPASEPDIPASDAATGPASEANTTMDTASEAATAPSSRASTTMDTASEAAVTIQDPTSEVDMIIMDSGSEGFRGHIDSPLDVGDSTSEVDIILETASEGSEEDIILETASEGSEADMIMDSEAVTFQDSTSEVDVIVTESASEARAASVDLDSDGHIAMDTDSEAAVTVQDIDMESASEARPTTVDSTSVYNIMDTDSEADIASILEAASEEEITSILETVSETDVAMDTASEANNAVNPTSDSSTTMLSISASEAGGPMDSTSDTIFNQDWMHLQQAWINAVENSQSSWVHLQESWTTTIPRTPSLEFPQDRDDDDMSEISTIGSPPLPEGYRWSQFEEDWVAIPETSSPRLPEYPQYMHGYEFDEDLFFPSAPDFAQQYEDDMDLDEVMDDAPPQPSPAPQQEIEINTSLPRATSPVANPPNNRRRRGRIISTRDVTPGVLLHGAQRQVTITHPPPAPGWDPGEAWIAYVAGSYTEHETSGPSVVKNSDHEEEEEEVNQEIEEEEGDEEAQEKKYEDDEEEDEEDILPPVLMQRVVIAVNRAVQPLETAIEAVAQEYRTNSQRVMNNWLTAEKLAEIRIRRLLRERLIPALRQGEEKILQLHEDLLTEEEAIRSLGNLNAGTAEVLSAVKDFHVLADREVERVEGLQQPSKEAKDEDEDEEMDDFGAEGQEFFEGFERTILDYVRAGAAEGGSSKPEE